MTQAMDPLLAIGGWGQSATTPVTVSEVAISAAGAVIVALLCAIAGRRQSRPRFSRLATGAWIMGLTLILAGSAGAQDAPASPQPEATPAREARLQLGGSVDGSYAYNFNRPADHANFLPGSLQVDDWPGRARPSR